MGNGIKMFGMYRWCIYQVYTLPRGFFCVAIPFSAIYIYIMSGRYKMNRKIVHVSFDATIVCRHAFLSDHCDTHRCGLRRILPADRIDRKEGLINRLNKAYFLILNNKAL